MPLNPNLLQKLTDANESSPGAEHAGALGATVMLAMEALKKEAPALDGMRSPEVRAAFENAFSLAHKIYGLEPPSPEEFAARMPDVFASLAEAHETVSEPEMLVTPHLTKQETIGLFARKARDTTIPNNPLEQRNDGDGLWISTNITDAVWDTMDTPSDTQATAEAADGTMWSLVVTSGANKPKHIGESYQDVQRAGVVPLTISQYLALQLAHLESGKQLVDNSTGTWLQGKPDSSRAPVGGWRPDRGRVDVDLFGVDRRGGRLGARGAV